MIDEAVLERLLTDTAEEIPVPAAGAEVVVAELTASQVRAPRPAAGRSLGWLAVAAAVVAVVVAIPLLARGGSSGSKSAGVQVATPQITGETPSGVDSEQLLDQSKKRKAAKHLAVSNAAPLHSAASGTAAGTSSGSGAPSGPTDGALIVKTGTLDLQVPHSTLHTAVNRVTGVAVGLGGYIADSKSSFDEGDATAQITIRVPVNNFEAAVTRLERLPDVKVLGNSENGTDVTAQHTDLQAQLTAATSERDAFLGVLANAQSVGDILAVRDRITAVETEMNQLQGQINVLNDQSAFSSIAVTLSEKPVHATTTAVVTKPPTGLSKSWRDARDGFSNSLEWLLARSGGALIVLLAALLLLFGIRYLYPVVRRGLL